MSREAQSPIDLPEHEWAGLPQGPTIVLDYESFVPGIEHGPFGSLVPVPAQDRPGLHVDELGEFALQQIHFHIPAEHRLARGDDSPHRPPAEIHFVHQHGEDDDTLAVIGVFVEVDPVPDAEPFHAIDALVDLMTHERTTNEINPLAMIPEGDLFSYAGSLTTYPYSEGVYWFVAREPVTISASQAALLNDLDYADRLREVAGQARVPQALNNRTVRKSPQQRR